MRYVERLATEIASMERMAGTTVVPAAIIGGVAGLLFSSIPRGLATLGDRNPSRGENILLTVVTVGLFAQVGVMLGSSPRWVPVY